jgi:hypothetical protein
MAYALISLGIVWLLGALILRKLESESSTTTIRA